MKKERRSNISKELIHWLMPGKSKDFYDIETVKRGREYIVTIYPLKLNRNLSEIHKHFDVKLISREKCVYKYNLQGYKYAVQ